jgi:hypothetical protein
MTASIYDLYETDNALETQGFWHPINKNISFLLARAGGSNMGFSKAMEKKTRSHRGRGGAFEDDNVDIELATTFMQEAFAETVILDWKGVTDKKGKKVPYSPGAAIKLMKDLPDLFVVLRDAASKAANFRAEEVKDDMGN